IPRRHLTNEKHNETLVTIIHQCEDYERCESMELDDKIRDLIAGTPEAASSHRNGHSPKDMAALTVAGAYTEHAQLLEVNQQWDQQFRNMKELYERKEKESLREELQALRRENELLKENNALTSRKKEHYVCEIKRLNKPISAPLSATTCSAAYR
ncbi:hypothetical protein STEG23_027894, partial [Scotinomys teguina]